MYKLDLSTHDISILKEVLQIQIDLELDLLADDCIDKDDVHKYSMRISERLSILIRLYNLKRS